MEGFGGLVLGEESTGIPDLSVCGGGGADPWILGEQRLVISDLCILGCGIALVL